MLFDVAHLASLDLISSQVRLVQIIANSKLGDISILIHFSICMIQLNKLMSLPNVINEEMIKLLHGVSQRVDESSFKLITLDVLEYMELFLKTQTITKFSFDHVDKVLDFFGSCFGCDCPE
jgi:hypothetical protein